MLELPTLTVYLCNVCHKQTKSVTYLHRQTITLPQVYMTHIMLTLLSHCETSCNSRNRRPKLASRYYTNNNMSSMLITQLVVSLTDKGKKQYVAISSYSIIQVELARQMS